jgi:hypothetical protein
MSAADADIGESMAGLSRCGWRRWPAMSVAYYADAHRAALASLVNLPPP